ncbi:MAG: aspartyl/glutamyl-tRNA amidotransferase subunit B [Nitrospirae bacterium RIFCSPLOWO2_02_FULL_62_14]|nr:MAG: aspartyl/glutamyl-tRNA amidotransferase subunit B [Nitrospirae bacterium RIFCSPLOWO2_02_FULL_62_14]
MATYETVIGLEVHAQLKTRSKMFCACGTVFGLPANTQVCPICLGMPGTLPVVNKKAIEMAIQAGLALNCTINVSNRFARKNYFYPDLPKGYQISQYESPICENGWVEIAAGGGTKNIRIKRAHLEEDAGKNVHETGTSGSRVDLNRAGTPLLEIVTEPDMRSADEVVAYLKLLRDVLVYLDVCDGNMEEGSLRCEPNLSLRPVGKKEFGTKVEMKNINSFKFVKDAIEYEIKRQTKVLNEGGKIHQETRLWDTARGETAVMRSKEEAHDYRYFPDPDLVPIEISEEWIGELKKTLPKLATEMRGQFTEEYGLTDYAAGVLTADKDAAEYFVQSMTAAVQAGLPKADGAREIANWATVDLRAFLNEKGVGFAESPVKPEQLAELVVKKHKGEISGPIAKTVLAEMFATGKSAGEIVKAKGLTQVSDEGALAKIIDEVIAKNPTQVQQYRGGKEAVLGFLVGQVMKASGGKANPGKVNELLKGKLTS